MKWMGMGLMLGASLWLARVMARPYRMRVAALDDWRQMLGQLEPLIGWRQMPLAEAFDRAARTHPGRQRAIASLVGSLGSRDEDFATAFSRALAADSALFAEDREALMALAPVLGKSVAGYQVQHLADARGDIERILAEARQYGLKKARLVESLVSVAGIAAIILLI